MCAASRNAPKARSQHFYASKQYSLENQPNLLQSNLNCDVNSVEYINFKNQLEEIYDDIALCIKVRSKYQWYEESEKSTISFLNLEKTKALFLNLDKTQEIVKKLGINNKETDIFKLLRNWKGSLKINLKGHLEKRNMYAMNFFEIFHYRLLLLLLLLLL